MTIAKSPGTAASEVLRNEFVVIYYDKTDSLLTIKWRRQIDFDERKEIFLWGYQFTIDNNVKNWLINDEEIFIITTQERLWVKGTWTKMASEAGIRKIAVYVPEYFYNSLQTLTDFTKKAQKKYQSYGITKHEVFTDYNMALTWIRSA